MSDKIIDLAVTTFSSQLEMRIQQRTSTLRGRVAEGTHRGKQASPVQYMNPVKVQVPAGRFSPLIMLNQGFERRWVFPVDGDLPQLVDSFDELRLISDPKSQYSTNAAAAFAREWDDRLIAAAPADAKLGTNIDAFSTESFISDYKIAKDFGTSGTSTGLTVRKLRELKRLMRHHAQDGNPDNEVLTIVAGSQQESDLLGETEIASLDYNERPVLVDGTVNRFMGFNFVWSERLATIDTNVRGIYGFMKSGLYLGVWKDVTTAITQRNDLSALPWQIYTNFACGATRLQKGKLFQIACADSTGASITP